METKKFIIYTTSISDSALDCAKEMLIEQGNENPKDDEVWEMAYMDNNLWCNDERRNLNKELDTYIVGFGTLGLWNGRVNCYKIAKNRNLNAILDFTSSDSELDYYVQNGDVHIDCSHHDGTNHLVVRRFNKRYSYKRIEELCEKYINNEISDDILFKCSTSIAKNVADVYGWKI